ncbi:MAG: TonB-dependent receptor [Bacteroidetes bacterium]|nr:MAG: TonB-dependent receptor [Bacteroidota bacterium]
MIYCEIVVFILSMRHYFLLGLFFIPAVFQAQVDSINLLQPAAVSAVTSDDRAPFTHTDINSNELKSRDSGRDMPFLLRLTPSVVVTSDAGNGIGYTGMRIRGIDASRINVTINGVPLNDSESQGVYWVDLPDLGASTSNLQIQRGVGTSTVGPGAFGGSIAVNTLSSHIKPSVRISLGGGSFNSYRKSVNWNSGMLGEGWSMEGRASNIESDGYVDRAASNLNSFYTSVAKRWDDGKLSFTTLLGKERTYQSWFGVPQLVTKESTTDAEIIDWAAGSYEYGYGSDTERLTDLLANRRTHNYYNYDDEVDDYGQNHLQLHLEQQLGSANMGLTLYSTSGAGYYEQFRKDDSFSSYGLSAPLFPDSTSPETTNIIRRRWLDNELKGVTFNVNRPFESWGLNAGASFSKYSGYHFGEVVWMEHAADILPGTRYYNSVGDKQDLSVFMRATYDVIKDVLRIQSEAQIRSVLYSSTGIDSDLQEVSLNDSLLFFNPKIGFDYIFSDFNRAYASFAVANREPARSDYLDSPQANSIRPEKLLDFELGYSYSRSVWGAEIGLYYMNYKDQIIATGALNDVGNTIKTNVPFSSRLGIELQTGIQITSRLKWDGNLTLSRNKIDFFSETLYDYSPENNYENIIFHENTDIALSPSVVGASIFGVEVWSKKGVGVNLEIATKYVGKQFLDNTSNDARSLPSYLVNDVILSYSHVSENGGELIISLFGNNILNEMYSANGWTYSYLYGGIAGMTTENYVYPQAGRNGFINIEFSF